MLIYKILKFEIFSIESHHDSASAISPIDQKDARLLFYLFILFNLYTMNEIMWIKNDERMSITFGICFNIKVYK